MKNFITSIISLLALGATSWANTSEGDFLIKVTPQVKAQIMQSLSASNMGAKDLEFNEWIQVKVPAAQIAEFNQFRAEPPVGVLHIQPNYKIKIPSMLDQLNPQKLKMLQDNVDAAGPFDPVPEDNQPFPAQKSGGTGADQLFGSEWGMVDIGVEQAWNVTKGNPEIVVAVIDTGVDYTHEDLWDNMWQNPGEMGTDSNGNNKATNGIDDDNNGYVDDLVGWDFVSNDNKPYDFTTSTLEMLFGGGNPGHGTHCAGNVAARGDNGKGISGVAPFVKIMGVRFLSEKGQGTTAGAIQSIKYAVDNGAHVLSNSWGSEGEDADEQQNQALRDAIAYSETNGRLFIAAAGNGHQGVGYDNDSDAKPAFPASYNHDIIVSVAALDVNDALGAFSNWGQQSVDIGAPGVAVFSTTVNNNYSDTVLDFLGTKVTWDGTSMATPHVAGAAALYWSAHPEKTWREVKEALLHTAAPISALNGKSVSGGKLSAQRLLNQ